MDEVLLVSTAVVADGDRVVERSLFAVEIAVDVTLVASWKEELTVLSTIEVPFLKLVGKREGKGFKLVKPREELVEVNSELRKP